MPLRSLGYALLMFGFWNCLIGVFHFAYFMDFKESAWRIFLSFYALGLIPALGIFLITL